MDAMKVVGGTLAAAGMINMVVHYDEKPHPHQEGPPDRPTMELTRPQYEVSSSASAMPPRRTMVVQPRYDEYYAAAHRAAQATAQMTMRRNAALFATADQRAAGK